MTTDLLLFSGTRGLKWPPANREPYILPPYQGDRELPFTPPNEPDLRFIRMDAWGVTIEGLPFVPGGSSEHPERCLTYFFYKWNDEWQNKILDVYVARGYTHFFLSLADAVIDGGMSIDAIVSMCRKIRARGLWVSMWLASKDYPQFIARDQTAQVWKDTLYPYLDALISNDCLHHAVIGGEFDLFNNPAFTNDIAQVIVDKCKSILVYFHFSTHVTWWGTTNRFEWTTQVCDIGVRGIYYQGDVNWDIPEYQARICDTLGRVDSRFDFVNHEVVAAAEFTQDHPDELDACIKGYATQCTKASEHIMGYGNGGYRPDGSYL